MILILNNPRCVNVETLGDLFTYYNVLNSYWQLQLVNKTARSVKFEVKLINEFVMLTWCAIMWTTTTCQWSRRSQRICYINEVQGHEYVFSRLLKWIQWFKHLKLATNNISICHTSEYFVTISNFYFSALIQFNECSKPSFALRHLVDLSVISINSPCCFSLHGWVLLVSDMTTKDLNETPRIDQNHTFDIFFSITVIERVYISKQHIMFSCRAVSCIQQTLPLCCIFPIIRLFQTILCLLMRLQLLLSNLIILG